MVDCNFDVTHVANMCDDIDDIPFLPSNSETGEAKGTKMIFFFRKNSIHMVQNNTLYLHLIKKIITHTLKFSLTYK